MAVSALTGAVTLAENEVSDIPGSYPMVEAWLQSQFVLGPGGSTASFYQPWLRTVETNVNTFSTVSALSPATMDVTAFSSDINLVGNLTLTPGPRGNLNLLAKGAINALQPAGVTTVNGLTSTTWLAGSINVSDANPASVPEITLPFAYQSLFKPGTTQFANSTSNFLQFINAFFAVSGATSGQQAVLQTKEALHDSALLHAGDSSLIHLYAGAGNISGLSFFSAKAARIMAGSDITDVGLYLQNNQATDITVISAGRDLKVFDANSVLRQAAQVGSNILQTESQSPESGDIQLGGPGTLDVIAARNLDLGTSGAASSDGTHVGITTIGNTLNPALPFTGAGMIVAAGTGPVNYASFIKDFLNPPTGGTEAARYLPDLATLLGVSGQSDAAIYADFLKLSPGEQNGDALAIFYLALRDAGRDHSISTSPGFNNYNASMRAIADLFPTPGTGDITLDAREIKTINGGDVNIAAPGGELDLDFGTAPFQDPPNQGIFTQAGGNINIFTRKNVTVGDLRIFTLRGGSEVIYSSLGNIAAGASSKTVQSAPPTEVLVDPQSGDIQTNLAGLATGGGIGVLESTTGVPPGDVDLIAPTGTVDAGDAGIRSSGNLNIAALHVLNASNIQAGGASVGVPVTAVAAPNLAGLTAASSAAGAQQNAASDAAKQTNGGQQTGAQDLPSIITVEVLGYGGGDSAGG